MSARVASVALLAAPWWGWQAVCFDHPEIWVGARTTSREQALGDAVDHNSTHRTAVAA